MRKLLEMLWWWPLGKVPEIGARELDERLRGEELQVVDVRTKVEFEHGHIAGAIHAPIQLLKKRLPTLGLDPTKPVVTICKSGHRSVPATRLFKARGFESMQLQDGIDEWKKEGLRVES
ncbi:MAG TPA: rhodanese-like domain-containing protein [Actinomycetota bacterium]|nr:rhodanese-like domain-containing protein [Actinomycetota bacterium]